MGFDRTDAADLAALKSEVENDPTGVGYAAVLSSTNELLGLLNGKTPSETVSKPAIFSKDVKSAVTYDAYDTLSIDEQEWIRWMTSAAGSELEDLKVTDDLKLRLAGVGGSSIWAAAHRTAMEAAMLDLIEVAASRVEVLFGYDAYVSRDDWFAARDS